MSADANETQYIDIDGEAPRVDDAVLSRHSIRDYSNRPVPRETLEELFELALRAPSWKNSQPWRIYVLTGATRDRVAASLVKAARETQSSQPDFEWPAAYPADARRRMFDLGMRVYEAAGIERKDKAARDEFMLRNFNFFGAPVGVFITTTFEPNYYVALDLGCLLESIMLLARARGLATCPQAALGAFPEVVRRELALSDAERVVWGLSMGYATPDSKLNRFHSPRAPLAELLQFRE